jgi:hypothetical protein
MRADRDAVRVGAIIAGAVGFLAGAAIVFVTTAGPSSANAQDAAPAAAAGPAVLAYDISGLPADAIIVVQRKNGPKGQFAEVARSAAETGKIDVGAPTAARSVMRITVVTPSGDVLMSVDRAY